MNFIIKIYKLLTIHHRYYKKFIMTKDDFVRSRFVVLFIFKFVTFVMLLHVLGLTNFSNLKNLKLVMLLILGVYTFIVNRIAIHCQKKLDEVQINLSKEKIDLMVYTWKGIVFVGPFIVIIVGALTK